MAEAGSAIGGGLHLLEQDASLRTHLGKWKPEFDPREWKTLVSADKFSHEVFCRLPNGSYEVFEEKDGGTAHRSLWVSGRSSKEIDTLPFDVVPAEMQVTTNNVKHCEVLYRGKSLPAPCRVKATSFSEYVAQQPKHVRRILSDCDLTETITQKLVSLLRSSDPVYGGGTDGGLLYELGTFGFVWGKFPRPTRSYPSVKVMSLGLPSSCPRPVRRWRDCLLLLRICA
jgi:hypothetical protein